MTTLKTAAKETRAETDGLLLHLLRHQGNIKENQPLKEVEVLKSCNGFY